MRNPVSVSIPAAAAALALALSGCGKSPPSIVVGSQLETGQQIVAEVIAQHLEHRLGRKVQRRLALGPDLVVYQELQLQHITLYPAFTAAIETDVLKEKADPDPSVVWQRAHNELDRVAKMELFNPLGYEDPPTLVVAAATAENLKPPSLSEAAASSTKWKIGGSYDFQQTPDLITALNSYHLPQSQPLRGLQPTNLFPALDRGDLNMIAVGSIEGRLNAPGYRILADDRHVFPSYQACILTRQDSLSAEPALRGYLAELSGKFTSDGVRKMSADVDLNNRQIPDVAAEFLNQAGLK